MAEKAKTEDKPKRVNPRAGIKRPVFVILLPDAEGKVDFMNGEVKTTRSADEALAIIDKNKGAQYRRLVVGE